MLLKFRGEFTRFQDPDKSYNKADAPFDAEIIGSKVNGGVDSFDPLPSDSLDAVPF